MKAMDTSEKFLWATGLLVMVVLFATNVGDKPAPHHLDSEFGTLRHAQGAAARRIELEDHSH